MNVKRLSLTEIKKRIEIIINSQELNFEYFEHLIRECLGGLPIPISVSNHEFLVRCRINHNGEVFQNLSQLSYNPDKTKIGLQRCNYPNQQVFYGSVFNHTIHSSILLTAVLETTFEWIKKEDINIIYTTASRWEIKRPLNIITMAFSEKAIEKSPQMKDAHDNYEQILIENQDTIKRHPDDCKEILYYINSFFETKEDKEKSYRVSASISNYLMKLAPTCDGIVYPSSNTDSAGLNIVLKKDLADSEFLKCTYIQMYKLVKHPNDDKKINGFPASEPASLDTFNSFKISGII